MADHLNLCVKLSSAEKGLFLTIGGGRNVVEQSFFERAPKISAAIFCLLHQIRSEKSFKVFSRHVEDNI